VKKVGVFYHPLLEEARLLAAEITDFLRSEVDEVWSNAAWSEDCIAANVPETDLLITIGGDGTVLRAARAVVPHDVVLLGVNLGRLGFLTELRNNEALRRLPDVLAGKGRAEERSMLHVQVLEGRGGKVVKGEQPFLHALNDVVLGRLSLGRTILASALINGHLVADYRADGVIVATATGSTAYSQSVGGPILHPEAREFVLVPLAPHLGQTNPLVLPTASVIELVLDERTHRAALSIDGETGIDIGPGQVVRITMSPHVARFLRLPGSPGYYERVAVRLRWRRSFDAEEARLTEENPPEEAEHPC